MRRSRATLPSLRATSAALQFIRTGGGVPEKSAPALSLGAVAAGGRDGRQGGTRPQPSSSPTTAGRFRAAAAARGATGTTGVTAPTSRPTTAGHRLSNRSGPRRGQGIAHPRRAPAPGPKPGGMYVPSPAVSGKEQAMRYVLVVVGMIALLVGWFVGLRAVL